ncbi:MAG: proton-conducting transporter membrane subunit [Candidatus Gastranaerophilaceae bacterium]
MSFILAAIILYFVTGVFLSRHKSATMFLSGANFVAMILVLIPSVRVLVTNCPFELNFFLPGIIGNVPLRFDALSAFFAIIVAVTGFLATVYAKGYLQPYIDKNKSVGSHLLFFNSLICAMFLVVLVQNALFFLISWEIMSISSLFLVAFESEKPEVLKASVKYFIYMHVSVLFIIAGFVLLNIKSGSLDFAAFAEFLKNNPQYSNIFLFLTFVGFGIKAGFFPFHNWLPDAHPAAPSHVSGLMSGVMIKTGIYGILRMLALVGVPSPALSYSVLFIALVSALYGVLYALAQHDLKKLLAYHSIENIGIIGVGIGCGMLGLAYNLPLLTVAGFSGALLHVLNHSIFKSLLFFGAGAVYNKTHTKNIELLGGLARKMPVTAVCFLIGAVAICGLPPLNGFVSEILIYFSMLQGMLNHNIILFSALMFSFAGLAFVGVMAILCFTKAYGIVFSGSARSGLSKNVKSDVSFSMKSSMVVLAAFCLIIGVLPKYVVGFFKNSFAVFSAEGDVQKYLPINFIDNVSNIALTLCAVCFAALVVRGFFRNDRGFEVWGCGYDKLNSKMQYTASSFVSSFLEITKPLFIKKVDVKRPEAIFPTEAHYGSHVEDIEEELLINPALRFDKQLLQKFRVLQNGNLQQYILYGLIFLVLMLVMTILAEC